MDIAKFYAPTHLIFGSGSHSQTGGLVQSLGATKVMVITDPGVAKAGLAGQIIDVLSGSNIKSILFDEVEANPSFETVDKAGRLYQEAGCKGLVAVGGGSPMDTAKAVGIMVTHPQPLKDYVGMDTIRHPLPPFVALPTTVGTGSEVTPYAVITDTSQRKKLVFGDDGLPSQVAILDPDLVKTLPSPMVAGTGMDTLTHAIESIISNFATPFSDAVALEAIHLVKENLPMALDPAQIEARGKVLYASTLAGLAISRGRTGLVHGMSHPVSSYYGVPHGLANAILLPPVLVFNAPTCQAGLARVAGAMGQAVPAGVPDPQGRGYEAAIDAVQALGQAVKIPAHLSEVGVTAEFIPQMSQDAYESGNAQVVNPRQPTLAEVENLYQQVL